MLTHILVPTDGSECSLKAATFAGDLARQVNAKVTILVVHDARSIVAEAWNTAAGAAEPESETGAEAEARSSLEKYAELNELAETRNALGEIPGELELAQIWGHPVSEICDFAENKGADLIVMGSHGRSGLKGVLLGSVSHAVVNRANCAVTITR